MSQKNWWVLMRSIFESPSLSEKKIDQNLSNRRNSSSNHGRQNYVSWRKIGTPSLSKSNKCSARCHFFYVPKTELFFSSKVYCWCNYVKCLIFSIVFLKQMSHNDSLFFFSIKDLSRLRSKYFDKSRLISKNI